MTTVSTDENAENSSSRVPSVDTVVPPLWKTASPFLIVWPRHPTPKGDDMKVYTHTKTYTLKFVALFIIAPNCKQLQPSAKWWRIIKLWCVCAMRRFSLSNRETGYRCAWRGWGSDASCWVKSQTRQHVVWSHLCDILRRWNSWDRKHIADARALGEGEGVGHKGYGGSWAGVPSSCLDCDGGSMVICIYQSSQSGRTNRVNVYVRKSHFNKHDV